MILPQFYIDDLIKNAITEDINYIDVATDYLLYEGAVSQAFFVAKADGVLCGAEIAMRVFELLDDKTEVVFYCKDGDRVKNGEKIGLVRGDIRVLLSGERTALNFLQRI